MELIGWPASMGPRGWEEEEGGTLWVWGGLLAGWYLFEGAMELGGG